MLSKQRSPAIQSDERYPQRAAKLVASKGLYTYLQSPAVGLWLAQVSPGQVVVPGMRLGLLSILGVTHEIIVPHDAVGRIEALSTTGASPCEVAYETTMFLLDPQNVGVAKQAELTSDPLSMQTEENLIFRSPTSGRYYLTSAPGKPPFVRVGDVISTGHTIGLLEVMKTFNRIHYGGDHFPATAQVVKIFPENGQDLTAGDALLQLVPSQSAPSDSSTNNNPL